LSRGRQSHHLDGSESHSEHRSDLRRHPAPGFGEGWAKARRWRAAPARPRAWPASAAPRDHVREVDRDSGSGTRRRRRSRRRRL